MAGDVAIRVEGLYKQYGFRMPELYYRAKNLARRGSLDYYRALTTGGRWALKDVSFEIRRGEAFGVIGRNGSGKSTLLKVLSGVCPPTAGRVAVAGNIFPMIELNAGMHMELTGRENARMLSVVMGVPSREVSNRVKEIEAFCELGEWFDRRVRTYSTGMQTRLGFGTAINVNADILLIDEVWAVGDLSFQQKSLQAISELFKRGDKTIILVTHGVRQAERICDRGLMLNDGNLVLLDDMKTVVKSYYEENTIERRDATGEQVVKDKPHVILDTKEIAFDWVSFHDENGDQTDTVETGKPMIIRTKYRLKEPMPTAFHFGFVTPDLVRLAIFNSIDQENPLENEVEGIVECKVKSLPLLPGTYGLVVSVATIKEYRAIYKGENQAFLKVVDTEQKFTSKNAEIFIVEAEWEIIK